MREPDRNKKHGSRNTTEASLYAIQGETGENAGVDLSRSQQIGSTLPLGMQIHPRGRKNRVIGRWTCYPLLSKIDDGRSAKRRTRESSSEAWKRDERRLSLASTSRSFSHPAGDEII